MEKQMNMNESQDEECSAAIIIREERYKRTD
jgi:hypothetical protein